MSGSKASCGKRVVCPACGHSWIWADRVHSGDEFVIYDLETTGLYPAHDEVIQIAAVRFRGGVVCAGETFFSFARPRRPIPAFIESYTGIGNRHVRDAPPPEAVVREFSDWTGEATLIAHNGLRFDSRFLSETSARHGGPVRQVSSLDSIHLSKLLFGNARGTGHSLDHVVSRLRVSAAGVRRHDARGDVELLGLAVERMWRQLGLDPAFNGLPRHHAMLPEVAGANAVRQSDCTGSGIPID